MGYDLHITRALWWVQHARYPILAQEVLDLVRREADLTVSDGPRARPDYFSIMVGDGDDWLIFSESQLYTKNPGNLLKRRMIEVGAALDAWVLGDDPELYEWNGHEVSARELDPADLPLNAYSLTRGCAVGGLNSDAPILKQEWMTLVASQPDFAVLTQVQAKLPSGLSWIGCPPVACWTGHPSGKPVPFFFDEDVIEVSHADPATVKRMLALAPLLSAKVLDGNDNLVAT
jgi:hypothetical protein